MNSLLISQLLEAAFEKGINLDLDTTTIESDVLLQAVNKVSLDALPRSNRKPVNALVIHLSIYIKYAFKCCS